MAPEGETSAGIGWCRALVFEADDLESARQIAARDPYVTKGVFARYELYETRVVFPR